MPAKIEPEKILRIIERGFEVLAEKSAGVCGS
jgi:hypothetical protein